jgi:hypothetical protein
MTNSYRIWQKKGKKCDKIKKQKNDEKRKAAFLSKVFLKLGRLSCDNLIGSRKGNNFWELFVFQQFSGTFFDNFFFFNCWPNLNYPQKDFSPKKKYYRGMIMRSNLRRSKVTFFRSS